MSVLPGSFDELKTLGDDQAPFMLWMGRNRELVERVAAGEVECCGEWSQPGYYGWCSLLCRPARMAGGARVDRCPVAVARAVEAQAAAAWLKDFNNFIGAENVNGGA